MHRIGLFDERLHYCMDYDYWLRAACAGARIVHVEDLLAAARLHEAAKTSTGASDQGVRRRTTPATNVTRAIPPATQKYTGSQIPTSASTTVRRSGARKYR